MEKNWDQKIRLSLEKNPNHQPPGSKRAASKVWQGNIISNSNQMMGFWMILVDSGSAISSKQKENCRTHPLLKSRDLGSWWVFPPLVLQGVVTFVFPTMWRLPVIFFPGADLFWGFQVWWKWLGRCTSYDEGITLHTGSPVEAMTLGRKLVMGSCWWAKTATTIAPVFPWYAFLCSLTVPNFPRHAEVEWSTWV